MANRAQPEQGLDLPPILSPFLLSGENAILPALEPNISRPPSASSQSSHQFGRQTRPSPRLSLQLPGLSQLAAITSSPVSRRDSLDSEDTQRINQIQFRSAIPAHSMTTTAVATAGLGGQPPVCQNCATSTTPMWRRDENGTVLCNACGLFLKLHGRARPISLKRDTIKSRNRVRVPGETSDARRKSAHSQNAGESSQSSDRSSKRPRVSQQAAAAAAAALQRSGSPLLRASAAGSNIAPQSLFDSIAVDAQATATPGSASSAVEFNHQSASSPRPEVGINATQSEKQLSYDGLQTRINELEVINALFKGRVEELETSQKKARANEAAARDAERTALTAFHAAKKEMLKLRQRVQEMELQFADRSR